MKFMHLADLHLGRSLGEFDLADDQRYMLRQILETAERENVDAVLIAGDVFDKSVPSETAVRLFDDFLSELAGQNLETFVISGNHDSDERLNYGSGLFEKQGIHIAAKYSGGLAAWHMQDAFGEIVVYALPFVKASSVRRLYPDVRIDTYEDAVRTVLASAKVDPEVRNILIAHQFVTGKSGALTLAGSESAAAVSVGAVEQIGYDCFDVFDYVALGHIHASQQVGRETVRYAGSLLKYSLAETDYKKEIPIVDFREKGTVSLKSVFPVPMRDVRHIKGNMEQLLRPENIRNPEDFIYVTLTDETFIDDAMNIIRQYYPNTVKLDYDNSHTHEIERTDFAAEGKERPFSELVSDFCRDICGTEISEEELRILEECL